MRKNLRPDELGEEAGTAYAAGFAGAELKQLRIIPGRLRAWDYADEA